MSNHGTCTAPALQQSAFVRELARRCDLLNTAAFSAAGEPLNRAAQMVDSAGIEAAISLAEPGLGASVIESDGKLLVVVPEYQTNTQIAIFAPNRGTAELIVQMAADLQQIQDAEQTVAQFSERLEDSYEQVHLLFRIARLLNCVGDPAMVMNAVSAQVRGATRFSWLMLKFGSDRAVIEAFHDACFSDGQLPASESMVAQCLTSMFEQGGQDDWVKILSPATHELARLSGQEVIAEPITLDGRVIGGLVAGGKPASDPDIDSFDTQLLDAVADFLGVFHQNVARFQAQHELFMGTLHALASAIDAKDHYTRGHSERVSSMAAAMASHLGFDAETVEQYRIAGLVHDVGKIGVPEAVLCKPGKLTDEEFESLKQHPRLGYEMLKNIEPLAKILPGVLHHHERWDGRGYPDRIAGENIPLIARVLALADTFDAMTSTRSYRKALPMDVVVAELRKNAGTQFDGELVEPFLKLNVPPP